MIGMNSYSSQLKWKTLRYLCTVQSVKRNLQTKLQNISFDATKCYLRNTLPFSQNHCVVWIYSKFHSCFLFFEDLQPTVPVTRSVISQRYLCLLQTFVVAQLQKKQCSLGTNLLQDRFFSIQGRAVQLFLYHL